MVKNPPSNAGDEGSIPGPGSQIPRAARQLSPCAATREAHELRLEKAARHSEDPAQPCPSPQKEEFLVTFGGEAWLVEGKTKKTAKQ